MKIAEISLEQVKKTFVQGVTTLDVLSGLNVQFQQGFSYAITGVSGSGKSTLLHLLAGIDTPTEGRVLLNGHDLATLNPAMREQILHKTIGLVFQLPYLIAELSVIENVMLKGLIDGHAAAASRKHAMDLLEMVGLAAHAERDPASLSGGQQQRVAIARAIFNKPAFLIADEPTGNLDEVTGNAIVRLLLLCQTEWKMGVIVSTHNVTVAEQMDVGFELSDGRLTEK
jgi:ABC-type lipoprotein export system ATPase subunit